MMTVASYVGIVFLAFKLGLFLGIWSEKKAKNAPATYDYRTANFDGR